MSWQVLSDSKNDAVSHNLCLGCGLCALNCPSQAIVMEEQSYDATAVQIRKSPSLRSHLCVHCGRCAAVCPSGTLQQYHLEEVLHKVAREQLHSVIFFCSGLNLWQPSLWEQGSIPAQMSLQDARLRPRIQNVPTPQGVLLEEVRCTGRLGARYLLRLILCGVRHMVFLPCGHGADGRERCQYGKAGTGIMEHVSALEDMMQAYGVDGAMLEVREGIDAAGLQVLLQSIGKF